MKEDSKITFDTYEEYSNHLKDFRKKNKDATLTPFNISKELKVGWRAYTNDGSTYLFLLRISALKEAGAARVVEHEKKINYMHAKEAYEQAEKEYIDSVFGEV